jgi:hypothetical protein
MLCGVVGDRPMIDAWKLMRPNTHHDSYRKALAASQKIAWRVEDIIGDDKRLDFSKAFLPESLARVEPLAFLGAHERLRLNQIRGNGYLCLFGVVEEFILPFILDHVRARLDEDDVVVRSLLQFAGEEAKHIALFRRFRREFERGFGCACAVIGPPAEIARAVLAHDPLAVALAVLQIEWATQRHYVESAADDRRLDPQFKSLLRHHWMEEVQHAMLDTLMIEALVARYSRYRTAAAVDAYLEIVGLLHAHLARQVELDLESFERATGRTLAVAEAERFLEVQRQAMWWTFLGSGMSDKRFLATLGAIDPAARERAERVAASLV